jgi:hypothetical protein
MHDLNKRLEKLEDTVTKHLEESGEIRNDIKWLKKAIYFVISSPIAIEIMHHVHTAAVK